MPTPTLCRCARAAVTPVVAAALLLAGATDPAGAHTVGKTSSTGVVSPALPTSGYLGIDVASHQHPDGKAIDWATVRGAGVRFAFIKVDEGAHGRVGRYLNPWFARDWSGAGKAGVSRGAYHYARPRLPISTAAGDADRFLNTVGRHTGELAPVLDLEESGGLSRSQLTAWATEWLRTVEQRTGRKPTIYSALWYWNSYLAGSTAFASYPFWIARYTANSSPGSMPGGWGGWNFWQYSAKGRVPGISGEVDLNVACSRGGYLGGFCSAPTYSSRAAAEPAAPAATTPTTSSRNRSVATTTTRRKATTKTTARSSTATTRKPSSTATKQASTKTTTTRRETR